MTFEAALREELERLAVDASPAQFERLCRHYDLLQRWNERMSLTAIRGPAEIARRHFGESVFLHGALPAAGAFVDVGSGAGFPGLPLAAFRPESAVTLVESRGRKAAFLLEASRGLANVEVARCRIADWEGRADWALLRGVAPDSVLPDLAERVERVAILGTDAPAEGVFGQWQGRAVPGSRRGRLWTGVLSQAGARCFT